MTSFVRGSTTQDQTNLPSLNIITVLHGILVMLQWSFLGPMLDDQSHQWLYAHIEYIRRYLIALVSATWCRVWPVPRPSTPLWFWYFAWWRSVALLIQRRRCDHRRGTAATFHCTSSSNLNSKAITSNKNIHQCSNISQCNQHHYQHRNWLRQLSWFDFPYSSLVLLLRPAFKPIISFLPFGFQFEHSIPF